MIDKSFLQGIGLNEDQIILLDEGLKKENRFRQILLQEKVYPGAVESILRTTSFDDVDLTNEKLLREKIRVEYSDFISQKEEVSKVTLL